MTTRSTRTERRSIVHKIKPLKHYFDEHPTVEDLMGQSAIQSTLVFYLMQVLEWLARDQHWFIIADLNIYQYPKRYEYPVAPDIAIFKDVQIENIADRSLRSWRLYTAGRPAPRVVITICSDSTWEQDILDKPARFAAIGVREYYVYDPNEPAYIPAEYGRLRGWRLQGDTMVERIKDASGRLWSEELASWLVEDAAYLRLQDRQGLPRLTAAEAERQATEAERQAKEAA
jgi:Uma2 family endonuclease